MDILKYFGQLLSKTEAKKTSFIQVEFHEDRFYSLEYIFRAWALQLDFEDPVVTDFTKGVCTSNITPT